jgi:hypothetical protein
MEKAYMLLGAFAFAMSMLIPPVLSAVITVCSSSCDSTTVQGGINAASSGDEVRITDSRQYQENVTINTSVHLTSQSGTSPLLFTTDATLIDITTGNVNISSLALKVNGSTSSTVYVIYADDLDKVNVSNVNATGETTNTRVMNYLRVSNVSIHASNLTSYGSTSSRVLTIAGDFLTHSNNITVVGNKFSSTGDCFILGRNVRTGRIENNVISCTRSGIGVDQGELHNLNISHNIINGTMGIQLRSAAQTLKGINITYNKILSVTPGIVYGIAISPAGSSSSLVSGNTVNSNEVVASGSNVRGALIEGDDNVVTNLSVSNTNSLTLQVIGNRNILRDVNASINGNPNGILLTVDGNHNRFYKVNITHTGTTLGQPVSIESNRYNNTFEASRFSTVSGTSAVFSLSTFANASIIDSQIVREGAFSSNYVSISSGSRLYAINSSYNTSSVSFNTNSTIYNMYYLDTTVRDYSGQSVQQASISTTDSTSVPDADNPTASLSASTNSSGQSRLTLTGSLGNLTYNHSSNGNGFLYFSNYDVNASKTSYYYNLTSVNLSSSTTLTLTISPIVGDVSLTATAPTSAWWNESATVSGTAFANGGSSSFNSSLGTITINRTAYSIYSGNPGSSSICTTTADSSGAYSCSFTSPLEVGEYRVFVHAQNLSGYTLASSQSTLIVRPTYGISPIGTAPRSVYEQPFIIQEPSGKIRTIIVRIITSRS